MRILCRRGGSSSLSCAPAFKIFFQRRLSSSAAAPTIGCSRSKRLKSSGLRVQSPASIQHAVSRTRLRKRVDSTAAQARANASSRLRWRSLARTATPGPFEARSSLLRAARKKSSKPATLVSVYFDTDKLKLRNKGLSLRVRRIGRRHVQTIKRESGESAALWEHPISGRQPDLDFAQDAALGPEFGK